MIENLRTPHFSLHQSPDMKEQSFKEFWSETFGLPVENPGIREESEAIPTIPYPD